MGQPYIVFGGREDVIYWLRTRAERAERQALACGEEAKDYGELVTEFGLYNEIADQLEASNLWKDPE